jgi:uncharacterized coiled-coil DUF342 family protein
VINLSQALLDINKILSAIDHIIQQYEWAFQEVNDCDKETGDLLHEIELTDDLCAKEQRKRYQQLKDVRECRRKAKDTVEQYKELHEYIRTISEGTKKNLGKLHAKIARIIEQQGDKTYIPRIRDDLTCTPEKPYNPVMHEAFEKAR